MATPLRETPPLGKNAEKHFKKVIARSEKLKGTPSAMAERERVLSLYRKVKERHAV